MSTTHTATAAREGRWWIITVDGIGVTQARRLADATDTARELVAVSLDIPVEDVTVDLTVADVDGIDVAGQVAAIRDDRARAAQIEHDASARAQALARDLAAHDVPLRDVGAILGVSHQRAHQLVTG